MKRLNRSFQLEEDAMIAELDRQRAAERIHAKEREIALYALASEGVLRVPQQED